MCAVHCYEFDESVDIRVMLRPRLRFRPLRQSRVVDALLRLADDVMLEQLQ